MGKIHDLVERLGRNEAKRAVPADQQHVVNLAADFLGDEGAINPAYIYSGFCLTALPHKALPPDQPWTRETPRVTLIVSPGFVPNGRGGAEPVGCPYGSRARLVLLWLQTQAVRSSSREIELGRSMNNWLSKMNVSVGGNSYKGIHEQIKRLAKCQISFHWTDDNGRSRFEQAQVAKGGVFNFADSDPRQGVLWEDHVKLSEEFYSALRTHPVPVAEGAIKALSSKSMAIDCYVWLAYRLHSLERPTSLSWPALYAQFGHSYKELRHFREEFIKVLQAALAVYPEARVTDEGDKGITLYPSAPPIPERLDDRRLLLG
ncbi:MAG TPA: replication protein RepA [Azospirillaceae bacterium]|nr:replication protein RepA [Azospirillaceae bacterium]